MVMVWIVVGAAFSTILHAALAAIFVGVFKVPPFTLAFNFMTLIFLIGALNFANGRAGGLIAPADAQVTSGSVSNTLRSAADAATREQHRGRRRTRSSAASASCSSPTASGRDHHHRRASPSARGSRRSSRSSARPSACSPRSPLGANGVAIYNGLWGFNSFDAALAIGGVFFVLYAGGRRSWRWPARSSRRCCSARSPRCSSPGAFPPSRCPSASGRWPSSC